MVSGSETSSSWSENIRASAEAMPWMADKKGDSLSSGSSSSSSSSWVSCCTIESDSTKSEYRCGSRVVRTGRPDEELYRQY
jgi:hypothetical protein